MGVIDLEKNQKFLIVYINPSATKDLSDWVEVEKALNNEIKYEVIREIKPLMERFGIKLQWWKAVRGMYGRFNGQAYKADDALWFVYECPDRDRYDEQVEQCIESIDYVDGIFFKHDAYEVNAVNPYKNFV